MSITSAMFSGVSGLLSNAEGINVIGNNLANVNTIGFKYNRMLFADMLYVDIGNNSQLGRGTQIQTVDSVMGQGAFENTEVVTDLAIQGEGLFCLGPPGTAFDTEIEPESAYFSRAGAFRLGAEIGIDGAAPPVVMGFPLQNPQGYVVLDEGGAPGSATAARPIVVPKLHTDDTNFVFQKITGVENNGTIVCLYADASGVPKKGYYIGGGAVSETFDETTFKKVGYGRLANPPALKREGNSLFTTTPTSGAAVFERANGSNSKVYSNSLEQSNVDMAAQFVKMILTQRAYSANSKTITTADEMTQEVLNLKR